MSLPRTDYGSDWHVYLAAVVVAYRTLCESSDNDYPSADEMQFEFEYLEDWIKEHCKAAYPSMVSCDKWLGREDRAILENDFAYIGISEYCGLVAIWIADKDLSGHYDSQLAALRDHWVSQISSGFLSVFGNLQPIGYASNGGQLFMRDESA